MTSDPSLHFDAAEIENMLDSGQIEFKNGQPVVVGNLAGEAIMNDVDTTTLYDQRTGVPSLVRVYEGNNTLARMLSKRDPETGQRIFTTRKPNIAPPVASVACWLHPSHPDFPIYQAMGMPRCKGASFASEQDVELHMRNKHKSQLELIMRRRADEREREDRDLQRQTTEAMLAAVQAMVAARPEPVAEVPVAAPESPVADAMACTHCDYRATSEQGLRIHVGRTHALT